MVAVEQAQAKTVGSSSSSSSSISGSTSNHPSPIPIPWELQSFLKLHGDAAAPALRWYKQALAKLLPSLAPLDLDAHVRSPTTHTAAAQAAMYRACMHSVVLRQLQLLDACDLSTL